MVGGAYGGSYFVSPVCLLATWFTTSSLRLGTDKHLTAPLSSLQALLAFPHPKHGSYLDLCLSLA